MSLSASLPRPVYLPILTPLSRAVSQDINLVFYIMVVLLTLLVLAVKLWGLVALTMAALALVPVMFTLFVILTLP